ncbi:MAG: cell division protein FtsQ/DivIB [Myxococcales bacterium]|jgi:cell division protein FtsQ|nr:cell division protein FtsQ/DivIB [Sphingomicrobium sp.]
MSAAHVRRGGAGRARAKKPSKVAVPKKIAKRLPVNHARANKMAGLVFGAFMLAIALVVLVALDIPAKAERAAASTVGHAGFMVSGYQIVGLNHMNRSLIDGVVTDELRRAADEAGTDKAPQALVNASEIRERLLKFGWIKDARILRRLPDTLVIDIVERKPAALWQSQGRLALIDSEGVVLDRVPVDQMPDLPLLIGPGANAEEEELSRLMADVPTLKPQLASATWVGGRRWDLNFQSGETVALPEGELAARTALAKFAKADKTTGLLGRGIVRFDLRVPGKMIVRLPHAVAEPGKPVPQQG